MKRTVFDWLLLSLCVITAVSCSKDDKYDDDVNGKGYDPSAVVVTLSAADVSFYGATLNGKLNVANELMPAIEFGFEYSKSADMSSPTKLAIRSMGADKKFQGSVKDLKDETKYYYRAYIRYTSTGVFVYGDVKSFTTTKFEKYVTIETLSAADMSFYGATLNGKLNVADEYMSAIEFGFEYSENADMSSPTQLAIRSIGTDKKFQGAVEYLKDETKYYYRAYIRYTYTSTGISVYGDVKSFTTTKFEKYVTIETLSATDVSYSGATLNGKLNVADEYMSAIEFGFECSENADMSSPAQLAIRSIGTDKKFQGAVEYLKDETKYYYRAYIRYTYTSTGISVYGDVKSFTTTKFIVPSGKVNGYEYVDLGLSVKWATCNVGASKPEDYGSYFAWGETVGDPYIEGKTSGYSKSFDWSAYKYCNGSSTTMTKYCTDSREGTVDNKTKLELSDDAAHVNWVGSWRMPTALEIDELLINCTWTWTTLNGVNGYKVTSKKAGYTDKFIFLPAAGYRVDGNLDYAGSCGFYWSSSLYTNYSSYAYGLYFYSSSRNRYDGSRYCGRSVRPVCP